MSSVKSVEKLCPNIPEFSQEFKVFEACVKADNVKKCGGKTLAKFWSYAKERGGATVKDDGEFEYINTIGQSDADDAGNEMPCPFGFSHWQSGAPNSIWSSIKVVCHHIIKSKKDKTPASISQGFYPLGYVVGYGKGVIYVWHTNVHPSGKAPPSSYIKAARRGTGIVKKWLLSESRFILESDADEAWFGEGVEDCGKSVVTRLPSLVKWSGSKVKHHIKQATEYKAVVEAVKIKIMSRSKLFKKYVKLAESADMDADIFGEYLNKANDIHGDLTDDNKGKLKKTIKIFEALIETYNESVDEDTDEE